MRKIGKNWHETFFRMIRPWMASFEWRLNEARKHKQNRIKGHGRQNKNQLTNLAMIKIKNIGLAGLVLAAAGMSPSVMAQTVSLYQGAYSYDVGGEFTAITSPSLLAPYQYAGSQVVEQAYSGGEALTGPVGPGFQTFCVQTGVDFAPASSPYNNGTPYNYSISLTSADYVNGVNNGGIDVNNLSVGVAWLYSQFAQGKLQGYDYANTGTITPTTTAGITTVSAGMQATRLFDAGELQAAIWALEGNQTYGGYTLPSSGDDLFYNEALAANGGLAGANAAATLATDDGVEILNLTYGSDATLDSAQNQLVYLGVPDGGASLALLGLGLTALAVFGRKLKGGQRVM